MTLNLRATVILFALAGLTASAQDRPIRAWVAAHQQQVVGELLDLLAIPNVAADRANIRKNAEHLRAMLAKRGFTAELLETAGNPLVYGELKAPGAKRTLLLYSHYDGQPVDAKAWQQPDPFTPIAARTRWAPASPSAQCPIGGEARRRLAHLLALGLRRQVAHRRAVRRGQALRPPAAHQPRTCA